MPTLTTIHPRQALFGTEPHPAALPVCDHYAGVEERMQIGRAPCRERV